MAGCWMAYDWQRFSGKLVFKFRDNGVNVVRAEVAGQQITTKIQKPHDHIRLRVIPSNNQNIFDLSHPPSRISSSRAQALNIYLVRTVFQPGACRFLTMRSFSPRIRGARSCALNFSPVAHMSLAQIGDDHHHASSWTIFPLPNVCATKPIKP